MSEMSGNNDQQPETRLAAIVHELNQPLTAIRTNAQAALRFLEAPQPDLEEVRTALLEIVEDDRRAADLVRRLLPPAAD